MENRLVKLFLRVALAAGMLSAVADRLGIWNQEISSWGNWNAFLAYTRSLNPWFPESFIPMVGIIATIAETLFGLCLLFGFRTRLFARLTGFLMLLFALAMACSLSIKAPLDYSVFAAAAAAFALGLMKERYFEIDSLFS